jgi:hypothetical protein
MVLSLWSALVLAASPAAGDTPGDVSEPGETPRLALVLAGLLEHWSLGPAVSVAASAGPDGMCPAFSVGLVSDMFDPDEGHFPRGIDSHLGLSLGARAGRGWEVEVRGTAAGSPVALGPVTVGVSSAVVGAFDGPFAVSFRAGPELAAHFRLGGTRHVLQPFLRYEWALWSRDRFGDLGAAGLLFLWGD